MLKLSIEGATFMKKLIYLLVSIVFITTQLHAIIVDVRINANSDDMIEEIASSNLYDEVQLDLVVYPFSGDIPQKIGLRFNNILIPNGATINYAYLEFQANQSNSGQTDITIIGENNSNPLTYSGASGNITGRAETTASVNWLSVPAWTSGQVYQTAGITTIIQELVNLGGWSSGNSMALMLKPFDATCNTAACLRQAVAYNGSALNAPLLHIVYNEPPTPPVMGAVPDATANIDINFTYDLSAYVTPTDGDPILSYDLNDTMPIGLTFDNSTGIISGLAQFSGVKTFTFTATDVNGVSLPAVFTLTIQDSLIADYRLDECFWLGTAYTDVKDNSFNNLHGTAYNSTLVDLNTSRINHSALLDGVANYIDVTHNASFDVTNQITISFWVYPTRDTTDEYYVSKQSGTQGWYIWFDNRATDRLEFAIRINGSLRRVRINKPAGWINNWHFISGTYDGNNINFYVDNLTNSAAQTGNVTNSTNPLRIGTRYTNSRYFSGNIDEVKIWNSGLSPTEISNIFTNESTGKNYNGTTRNPITCNATILANTWEMIGIPTETRKAAIGVQSVFGDDFNGTAYNSGAANGWTLWKLVPQPTNNYSSYSLVDYIGNEVLDFGAGYFLGSGLDVTWDVDGLERVDYNSSYNGTSDCMAKHCVEVPLSSVGSDGTDGSGGSRYNLAGFIGNTPIDWKDCRFIVSNTDGSNVEVLTPQEAETAGYALRTISLWMGGTGSGSGGQILSGDYTDCTDTSPGGCQLIPYHGAWIELLVPTLTKTVKLLIPEE